MKQIRFPNNATVPALGQGTWHMGMGVESKKTEVDALRYGMDLGMTLIDTAEMYHDAETVVAQAIKGHRDEVFIVSKVLPSNASREGTILACEKSLDRLEIDCIDLYLLHWAGSYPLQDTLDGFQRLVEQGKIASYGVSNFDIMEMKSSWDCGGGQAIATNQILYNLQQRGVEWDLLPWCRQRNIPIMAYSPLGQGRIDTIALKQIANRHDVNEYQIALAWLLHQEGVVVIPKSAKISHIDQNFAAASINLTTEDIEQLDQIFPPPDQAMPLALN